MAERLDFELSKLQNMLMNNENYGLLSLGRKGSARKAIAYSNVVQGSRNNSNYVA